MYITLKMTIQDVEEKIEVNLTNRAGRIYRQQFGRDLIDDMTEIYQKIHKNPFEGIDFSEIDLDGKTEEEVYRQIMSKVDVPKILSKSDNMVLNFDDTEKVCQIVWAFAKNRNLDTPDYMEWIDSFDFVLPVNDLLSALYNAWNKTAQPTVELKN